MKLSALAAKPQLKRIQLDDEKLVEKYGEVIEYWTWDRYPAETYFNLSGLDSKQPGALEKAIRPIVLDETGSPILTGDVILPFDVMMRVLETAIGELGNENMTGEANTN